MEVLGIDVGGSGIKGAPVNTTTGSLLSERYRVATPTPATPEQVAEVVNEIVNYFDWSGPVGCGFPAPILHGVAQTAANIDKAFIGTNVEQLFQKATGCSFKVINDADAAGYAEMRLGAGQSVKDGVLLLITVGTGLGSALFTDGRLVPNTELGHLIFKDGGLDCEGYASDAVRKREDLSWDEWAGRFNEVLNYLHSLFYPDMIIIGGGASKKFDLFAHLLSVNTKVVPAQTLNQAGIIGASMAARDMLSMVS